MGRIEDRRPVLEELLTTHEAARALRVSQKTVLRLIRSRDLRAQKVGRSWRIRRSDLPCASSSASDEIVYLDDNASNPIHPGVIDAMVGVWALPIGNASSAHEIGQRSRSMIEESRSQVAELVSARPNEVVFTSGATEANNLILRGFPYASRRRVLVSAGEHDSVLRTVEALADLGVITCSIVPLAVSGCVDTKLLAAALSAGDVALVCTVAANSETGVLNPINEIADLAHGAGAFLHCDATQWVGRLPWSMEEFGVDAIALSGHKMCGPQGVGALVVRRPLQRKIRPLATGGGHEDGLRSGSYNVAGIVGLGVAATLAADGADAERIGGLRDRLVDRLHKSSGLSVNGLSAPRLPNTANVRFEGAPGDAVLARSPGVAASLGSACHAGSIEPSPTLLAMGLSRDAARESIRLSVTRFTTASEIDRAAAILNRSVSAVREVERVA